MITPMELLNHFSANLESSLALLQHVVEMESHSLCKHGIDQLSEFLAREFEAHGAQAEISPSEDRGNVLKAVWRGCGSGRPVLFLGHLDTVWAPGTIVDRPFALKDGKAYGPGVFDMKGGILICLLVCRAFSEQRPRMNGDVIFFFASDEEIGSAASLPLLATTAKNCRAVLCMEPPLPGGKAKTSRRGVGTFHVRVAGLAAHAGVDHEKGASAILELSRQVIRLQKMTSYDRGVTVNVGTIHGGSAVNVVPGMAEAEVDFRFATMADGQNLERRIRRMQPHDERCRLEFEGSINRPPLERTPAVAMLFQKAKRIASSIGMELDEGATGGASDGSFTAALGVPTLDGLGVEGDGAHAAHEHILIHDIPQRATLLSLLAQELMQ
jgi:glutamate carboxypeptidase